MTAVFEDELEPDVELAKAGPVLSTVDTTIGAVVEVLTMADVVDVLPLMKEK